MRQPEESKYVPALGFGWLTPYYDIVVRVTTRERDFHRAAFPPKVIHDL